MFLAKFGSVHLINQGSYLTLFLPLKTKSLMSIPITCKCLNDKFYIFVWIIKILKKHLIEFRLKKNLNFFFFFSGVYLCGNFVLVEISGVG